ncbi:cold-regulated 413 inner membrane protein 1, chloroplastic-like [Telopea speciosissima]|uniref:cold-regulated 413 inner membrane protein 1, chloroplastic-like n=1 Tax=Telopea speciosissima TaxID=54955 RepID=UPI001CC3512F|nr:cold-regulated 413 inner membrane protein 1, chloroplastic-like [Telopea speciosissima]XP_043688056.1 cold-regulated 413 inner membrane protein 1, chloroplastic-like [Telopea speciosissima]
MMLSLTLTLPQPSSSLRRDSFPFCSPHLTSSHSQSNKLCSLFNTTHQSNNPLFHPLRFSPKLQQLKTNKRGSGAVCYAAPLSPRTLQWVCTVASAILAVSRGTAVQKSFLVPLFALQAPSSIVSWIKSEYGNWIAFLALLVRLFFFIPGELELPFMALLLMIVAPLQVMNLRGTQEGAIASLVIAAYLAYQHFSRAGSLQSAFDQGSIIATLAVICITVVPCLLLI